MDLIDPLMRRGLAAAIREAIEGWCIWLSTGAWGRADPVPAGRRCTRCAGLGLDALAVHGAAHELSTAIERVEVRFLEQFAIHLVEPPGDGALQEVRAELRCVVMSTLLSARLIVGNAMLAYVLPRVDRVVAEASRWIDTGDHRSLG